MSCNRNVCSQGAITIPGYGRRASPLLDAVIAGLTAETHLWRRDPTRALSCFYPTQSRATRLWCAMRAWYGGALKEQPGTTDLWRVSLTVRFTSSVTPLTCLMLLKIMNELLTFGYGWEGLAWRIIFMVLAGYHPTASASQHLCSLSSSSIEAIFDGLKI